MATQSKEEKLDILYDRKAELEEELRLAELDEDSAKKWLKTCQYSNLVNKKKTGPTEAEEWLARATAEADRLDELLQEVLDEIDELEKS